MGIHIKVFFRQPDGNIKINQKHKILTCEVSNKEFRLFAEVDDETPIVVAKSKIVSCIVPDDGLISVNQGYKLMSIDKQGDNIVLYLNVFGDAPLISEQLHLCRVGDNPPSPQTTVFLGSCEAERIEDVIFIYKNK